MTARERPATLNFRQRQRDASRPLISIVVPVYNEEGCLSALHARLTPMLRSLTDDYEIILVNDGSQDRSLEILRQLQDDDPHVGYVSFARNFGHEAATTCGLLQARGQTVVIIDADLQDPPEVIPEMLAQWEAGYDLVYAQRRARYGESAFTRLTSHLFYRVLQRVSKVDVPVDTGDFRLMDRAVVDAFAQLPERNRFVRGMIAWTGFSKTNVRYERDARHAGETKYYFAKRLSLAFDAICGMSTVPLRWITYAGALISLAAAGGVALGMLAWLVSGVAAWGWLALASCVVSLTGGQLLTLGLVGEYVGRIYTEVQARPLYVVVEDAPAAGANAAARRAAG